MLRKKVVVFLILMLIMGTASAQTLVGFNSGFGCYSMSGVSGDQTEAGSVFRGNVGFTAVFPLCRQFSIIPGLFYISRGMVKTHNILDPELSSLAKIPVGKTAEEEMTEDIALGYLQIPLVIRYELPIGGKIKPNLLLGPTLAINISSNNEISGFGAWDGDYDIGNLRAFDFGALLGAGVTYPVWILNLSLDILYEHSFISAFEDVSEEELAEDIDEELWTKIDPVTYERTTEAVDFKNRGMTFRLGVTLPFNKIF